MFTVRTVYFTSKQIFLYSGHQQRSQNGHFRFNVGILGKTVR